MAAAHDKSSLVPEGRAIMFELSDEQCRGSGETANATTEKIVSWEADD